MLVGMFTSALKVHGARSAVTANVVDELVSHGVSTYVRFTG